MFSFRFDAGVLRAAGRAVVRWAGVTCAAAFLAGCAYRTDLTQGNFVEQEMVDRLRAGMTPEQVRFIMGTPMLIDAFDASRWYYVHFIRRGWSDPEIKNLVLIFSGMALTDMAGDFSKPSEFDSPDYQAPYDPLADLDAPAASDSSESAGAASE